MLDAGCWILGSGCWMLGRGVVCGGTWFRMSGEAKGSGPCFRMTYFRWVEAYPPKNGPDPCPEIAASTGLNNRLLIYLPSTR